MCPFDFLQTLRVYIILLCEQQLMQCIQIVLYYFKLMKAYEEPTRKHYKIIFIGPWNAGKTSIIRRFCNGTFLSRNNRIEFFTRELGIPGTAISLSCKFWDTEGQERFRPLADKFYHNADAAVLVFDIHEKTSEESAKKWLEELYQKATLPKVLAVVANKLDLVGNPNKAASAAYERWKAETPLFFAVSAKTGDHINTLFNELAKTLYYKEDAESDKVLKILVMGNKGAGKSSIIERATLDIFRPEKHATAGGNVVVDVKVKGKTKGIQLINFEDKESVSKAKGNIEGFIIVYDLMERDAISILKKHLAEIYKYYSKNPIVKIVGNKADLINGPVYNINEVSGYAKTNKIAHKIVSAKNGFGIARMLEELANEIDSRVYVSPQFIKEDPSKETAPAKCVIF
eukprot:TRINITY_DN1440_c0_g1_i1.p1 TRINITY_DN1440_c0_g1~~TRINITY_DN1440_c0_g1_i1.p1  ORF type:complete len:401 (+),score=45.13 TRINITY_DN1440_c0_g1_i1:1967-3169(+)